jgi:hypothetical protein
VIQPLVRGARGPVPRHGCKMKTVQAIGVGFGLAVGFGVACVTFVMCGAAAIQSSKAQPLVEAAPTRSADAPPPQTEPSEPESFVAGWVLFDGDHMAMCRTQVLPDATEETVSANREKMKGWSPLPAGSNCETLGGQVRGTCTGDGSRTTAFHYVGATAFGHVELMRKACIQKGHLYQSKF